MYLSITGAGYHQQISLSEDNTPKFGRLFLDSGDWETWTICMYRYVCVYVCMCMYVYMYVFMYEIHNLTPLSQVLDLIMLECEKLQQRQKLM